tara:strand:- start:2685 stop:2972 length:288 start_codon:yes stop_codon:yes gene_type:complete
MTTFHDPDNHIYINPPCPQGITINDDDLNYIESLRNMSLKELKEECINKNCSQSISGCSNKGAKKRNLIAKKLNKREWWFFSRGERIILEYYFLN